MADYAEVYNSALSVYESWVRSSQTCVSNEVFEMQN